ncbi:MAG: alpha-amylase family protein [bacterium]
MRKNPTVWEANNPDRNWHINAFFGLHYDLHAGAQDTELGAGLTYEHLRTELKKVAPDWVQCDCKGHPGYTSWPTEVGSTSPGVVKDALRIHRDVTRELGIPLVMHYSGVWDNRAIELHPDWACVGPEGAATGKEGFITGGTCNLSPYTTELMIPQMLELIEKYDVDGFWVDGENWATKPCYCERCTGAFTAATGITVAPKSAEEPHWQVWSDFHRHLFEEHVRAYADAIHAKKPDCLVCSNWMYTIGQPSPITVPIDYISGDFTWRWSTADAELEGRFMDSRGLSWDLMAWGFTTAEPEMAGWTFKTAANLCQEAACIIALGGGFQIFNNPQRSGHINGWQQDIVASVAQFVRARQPWCQGSETVPQVAVLHAAAHFYTTNTSTLMSKWNEAHLAANGALTALLENGCSVDILNEEGLLARMRDYPALVIAEQTHLSDEFKAAVADYVRCGGRLLLTGTNVAADFPELAGVIDDGEVKEGYFYLPVGREATTVKGPRQPVTLNGATALTMAHSQQEPGANATDEPVVTLNTIGTGRVLAVHARIFDHFQKTRYPRTRALVGEWLTALAPELLVEAEMPARVHLVLRTQQDRLLIHLVNLGTTHPMAPNQVIVEDVPPAGPINLRIRRSQPPQRVYLAPSMEGLSWDWRDGELTVKVVSVGIMDCVVVE